MLTAMDGWMAWLQERMGQVALVLLGLMAGVWWWHGQPVSQPPGVLAPTDPHQGPPEPTVPWIYHKHTLTPLANFEVRARILSAEDYHFDRAAELSPVDLALGWGPMSDSRVLGSMSIRQSGRWYFWSSGSLPIPPAEVTSHSANMHLIPANTIVARRLLQAKPGQIIHLEGQLVRADGRDGWHWVSSLSRTDSGDGSCEVVWVEQADVSNH